MTEEKNEKKDPQKDGQEKNSPKQESASEEEVVQERKPRLVQRRKSLLREYTEAIVLAAVIAIVLRIFLIEAFKIPTPSMYPTLFPGDHIFVNKGAYGLGIPYIDKRFWQGTPGRGDVVVFIYPEDESLDFIKRVIGVPGDRVEIRDGRIFLNDRLVEQKALPAGDLTGLSMADKQKTQFLLFEETLEGRKYSVMYRKDRRFANFGPITVSPGHLFVLGDNRDDSSDSRFWGTVPVLNVKGEACCVWISLDYTKFYEKVPLPLVRLGRIGQMID